MPRPAFAVVLTAGLLAVLAFVAARSRAVARTYHVPGDAATIQAAVDLAADGDTVLVAPGTWSGRVTIEKAITLASHFHVTGDEAFVDATVLDGGGDKMTVRIKGDGPAAAVIGFTITNADKGLHVRRPSRILHNRIRGNRDGIDYEGYDAGLCAHNLIEENLDDGIDLDHAVRLVIEHNVIRRNGGRIDGPPSTGDGIEIRLEPYAGPPAEVFIRENVIEGNAGDGIQVIDFEQVTGHVCFVERNLILGNRQCGIGFMADGETLEDEIGHSIAERVVVANNVLEGNKHGMTGGGPLVVFVNNVVIHSAGFGLRNPAGDATVARCLFWGNGTDLFGVETGDNLFVDPELDGAFRPSPASPLVGAGLDSHRCPDGTILEFARPRPPGRAPDIGAFEPEGAR